MNTLEFIEREIGIIESEKKRYLIIESEKKRYLTKFRYEPNDVYLNNFIESLEKKIDYLQQIKSELEAWYVVKDKVEIKRTEVFDHVLRIKQGKGALTHEEFRPLKNLIRVGDK